MARSDAQVASTGPSLAVFDCDGTLVDSQQSICMAMVATLENYGYDQIDGGNEAVRRLIGLPLEDIFLRLVPGISVAGSKEYAEHYKRVFRAMRHADKLSDRVYEPLFPGARETVRQLYASDWLLGIATGKASYGLAAALEPHDMLDFFVTRQTADIAKGKPDPDMLERAMKETGAGTGNTVMIGDTTFDMEMASHASVSAIGVAWGYHDEQDLLDAGAATVIRSFDQLPGALENTIKDAR